MEDRLNRRRLLGLLAAAPIAAAMPAPVAARAWVPMKAVGYTHIPASFLPPTTSLQQWDEQFFAEYVKQGAFARHLATGSHA